MSTMRVLLCHNYYQVPGGEDRIFEDEARLLEQHGHQVIQYQRNNDDIGGLKAITAAAATIWNSKTYREIKRVVSDNQIQIVHCTNTFPLISPSVYYACDALKIPVVQTLQNYRLHCANSYFLRDGKVCEKCFNKSIAWPAIVHRCYRESTFASATVAATQAIHHAMGSWSKKVDAFVVPTEFAKQKFADGGLPPERIFIKPNFVAPAPTIGQGDGGYALFVGRLSKEKGIDTLLDAWQSSSRLTPLKIVGGGPLEAHVRERAEANDNVEFVGFRQPADVLALMQKAQFLVVPSIWYEGLPRTIVESLAVGTPVIASALGPLKDIVRPGGGGRNFEPGNATQLESVAAELSAGGAPLAELRHAARLEFEDQYCAEKNYQQLIRIYEQAGRIRELRSNPNT